MTRITRAIYGQLAGVFVASVAVGLVFVPLGLLGLGASLVWWFRYVYDVGEIE